MKLSRLAALVASAAIAVGACTTGGGAAAPSDPLGVVTIRPGEPIHIAAWGVLSGADAPLGQDVLTGVQIAVEDKSGNVTGSPHPADHRGRALHPRRWRDRGPEARRRQDDRRPRGLRVLRRDRRRDQDSDGCGADHDLGLQHAPGADLPRSRRDVRRLPPHGAQRLVPGQGRGRVRLQLPQEDHGRDDPRRQRRTPRRSQASSPTSSRSSGGTILIQEAVSKGQTDMKPVLTRIAASAPEVLYFPVFISGRRASSGPSPRRFPGLENTTLIGSDGLFSVDFVKAAGPGAEGMYLSSPELLEVPGGLRGPPREVQGEGRNRPGSGLPCSRVRRHEHPVRGDREGGGEGRRRHAHHPAQGAAGRDLRHQGLPGRHRRAVVLPIGRLRRAADRGLPDHPPGGRRRVAAREADLAVAQR